MKKTLVALAIIGAAAFAVMAAEYIPSQGLYIDGSTNTVNMNGGNSNVCVVLAASTNNFNLSNTIQGQANTNIWPALPFTPRGSSSRYLGLCWSYKGVDANATNDYVWRFAVSSDGSIWKSNYTSVSSKGQGSSIVVVATNLDTGGFPFFNLQTEEAPTVSGCTAITNVTFSAARKPGI